MIEIVWVVLAILLLWSLFLTFLFWRLASHYNNLLRGSNNRTLQSLLEKLLKDVDIVQKDIDTLKNRCDTIEKDGALHIQKIGLLRFNPFKDTGGDQSFILSLLDGQDTGVVISGLYSRAGTRWYAKKVAKGQGIEHVLSEEEKSAIKEARQLTPKHVEVEQEKQSENKK
jgi:hypothetical protein